MECFDTEREACQYAVRMVHDGPWNVYCCQSWRARGADTMFFCDRRSPEVLDAVAQNIPGLNIYVLSAQDVKRLGEGWEP